MKSLFLVALGMAGALAVPAFGVVTINEYNSGKQLIGTRTIGSSDTGVALDSFTQYVDILPADNNTTIPKITFTITGTPQNTDVYFYVGADNATIPGPYFKNEDAALASAKRGFLLKGIDTDALTPTTWLYGGITGDFGIKDNNDNNDDYEDQFLIRVDKLVRFDVGGSVIGDFEVGSAGGTPEESVFVIEGGGFSNTCEISLSNGSIKRILAANDMKAQITVEDGDIDLIDAGGKISGYGPYPIWAWRGKIGTIRAATEISQFEGSGYGVPMIRANEGIDAIICTSGFIEANIVANDTTYDATVTDGSIRKIVCDSLYELDVVNNVKTTIIASKFKKEGSDSGVFVSTSGTGAQYALLKATGNAESEIIFGGDILANGSNPIIEIGGSLIDDSTLDGSLVIGGSLAGKVKLGAQGLKGQVIINANDASETWTGDVVIGSTTISTSTSGFPYYNIPSSDLGGGAVGLVPYYLYGVDCIPAKADSPAPTILDSAFNQKLIGGYAQYNTSIKLRFYGPVFQNDTDPAIKIEQDLGGWVDLTDRAVVTFGSATGGNPRERSSGYRHRPHLTDSSRGVDGGLGS